ncbi:MAG: PAS domain S-box protein [Anaerolineae bacterium]|nr:PAS domain S-box protein [Anaerolineae bacterium]
MDWNLTPYLLPYLIAGWLALLLVVTALPHRRSAGAFPFILIQLLVFFGAIFQGLLILSTDLNSKVFWHNLLLTSLVLVPPLWLMLVLDMRNQFKWLRPLPVTLMLIVPVAALVIAWTNPMHRLFFWHAQLASNGFYPTLELSWNIWFWISLGHGTLMLLAALVTLLWRDRSQPSWAQRFGLMAAILLPAAALALDLFGLDPLAPFGLTAGVVTITSVIAAGAIFQIRLFKQQPNTRDAIFQSMTTGVIVLDNHNHIADLNAAARRYLQSVLEAPQQRWQGVDISELLSGLPEWAECLTSPEITFTRLTHGSGAGAVWFDLQVTPLMDRRARTQGRVILLQDVSESKQVEDTILASEKRYRQLLDGAPFPIVITSLHDNAVLYYNQQASQLFDEAPGSAIGNPAPAYYVNPAHRKELVTELQRSGVVSNFEVEYKTGRGKTFWALTSASKISYLSQPAIFASFDDISDRKQIELELNRTLEELTLFNQAMVGREQRMIELKEEINRLLAELGRDAKYPIPPPDRENPQ